MNEELVQQVNQLVNSFKENNLDEKSLSISFAVAVILMQNYGLVTNFNSLMNIYNSNNFNTIDV